MSELQTRASDFEGPFKDTLEAVFGTADRIEAEPMPHVSLQSRQRGLAAYNDLSASRLVFRSRAPKHVSMDTLHTNVLFLCSGSLSLEQVKGARNVEQGEIVVFSNWSPFVLRAEEDWSAMVVRLPAWWAFQQIVPDRLSHTDFHLPRALFSTASAAVLARSIFDEGFPEGQAAQANLMLAQLLKVSLDVQLGSARTVPKSGSRIGELIRYICVHVQSEDVSPQAAATALKCSLRTIHKACADHGTSFNSLLMDARIHGAAYLLTTTKSSISEIAFSLGFSSFSHFCRLFKNQIGVPASAYRQRYQTA